MLLKSLKRDEKRWLLYSNEEHDQTDTTGILEHLKQDEQKLTISDDVIPFLLHTSNTPEKPGPGKHL